MQEMWVQLLGWEDTLEEEMATLFNILAWKIPCTEEPDKLFHSPKHHKESDTTERLSKHTYRGTQHNRTLIIFWIRYRILLFYEAKMV